MSENTSCPACDKILPKYKESVRKSYKGKQSDVDYLILHTSRHVIGGSVSKDKKLKEQKVKDVARIVDAASALRNSRGGEILIHVKDQDRTDQNLEFFDEAVSAKLHALIEDGSLYTSAFERHWFGHRFIVLTVKQGKISTSDFSTKIRTDHENVNPNTLNILSILSGTPHSQKKPRLRGLKAALQEDRHIEVKRILPDKSKEIKGDLHKLISHIWNSLKFPYNLTSLSKLPDGGSFYVGVEEKPKVINGYHTKANQFEGFLFNLDDKEKFRAAFVAKITSDISVLQLPTGFKRAPSDLIDIEFYDRGSGLCILEISVRFFDGIVFCDKEGPKTYKIQENRKRRMERGEWLQEIKKFKIQPLEQRLIK